MKTATKLVIATIVVVCVLIMIGLFQIEEAIVQKAF